MIVREVPKKRASGYAHDFDGSSGPEDVEKSVGETGKKGRDQPKLVKRSGRARDARSSKSDGLLPVA